MTTLSNRRAAAITRLTEIKDVTLEDAIEIRNIWKTVSNRVDARNSVDKVLGTCGVEYLGRHKRTGEHVYYANAGDGYTTTVIFAGLSLSVGCWADLVEKNLIHEA